MPLRDAIELYATDADRAEIARERDAKDTRSKALFAESDRLRGRDLNTKIVAWYDSHSARYWRLRLDEDRASEGFASWARLNPGVDYDRWFADALPLTTSEGRVLASKLNAEAFEIRSDMMKEALDVGALARGLLAKLRDGTVVALGRLPPHFAILPIPAADWAGEWRLNPLDSTAVGGGEPLAIRDVRILPTGAAPASRRPNAGRPPRKDWPEILAKFDRLFASRGAREQPANQTDLINLVMDACENLGIKTMPKTTTIRERLKKDRPDVWARVKRLRSGGS